MGDEMMGWYRIHFKQPSKLHVGKQVHGQLVPIEKYCNWHFDLK